MARVVDEIIDQLCERFVQRQYKYLLGWIFLRQKDGALNYHASLAGPTNTRSLAGPLQSFSTILFCSGCMNSIHCWKLDDFMKCASISGSKSCSSIKFSPATSSSTTGSASVSSSFDSFVNRSILFFASRTSP